MPLAFITILHWLTPVEPAALVPKRDNPIHSNHARFQTELIY